MSAPTTRRRLLILAVAILAIVALVRLSLPTAVSYGLTRWLETKGAPAVALDSVALDLTDGRFEIAGLGFSAGGVDTRLDSARVEFSWGGSGRDHLRLTRVDAAGLALDVGVDEAGRWRVAGLSFGDSSEAAEGGLPPVTIELATIRDAGIAVTLPGARHRLEVRELRLGLVLAAQSTAAGIALVGRWDETDAALSAVWTDRAGDRALNLRADLPAVDLQRLAEQARTWDIALPALEGRATVEAAVGWRQPGAAATARGSAAIEAAIEGLAVGLGERTVGVRSAGATGRVAWQPGQIDIQGRLSGAALRLAPAAGDGPALTIGELSVEGQFARSGETPRASGRFDARQLALRRPGTDALVTIGAIRNEGFDWGPDGFAAPRLAAEAIDVLGFGTAADAPKPKTALRIARAELAELRFAKRLSIGEVRLAGLDGRLIRDADGRWLPAAAPAADAEADPDAAPEAGLPLRIGRITADRESRVHFEDHRVRPIHRRDLAVEQLTIAGFDSAGKSPARIELRATVDRHAPLTVAGTFRPDDITAALDLAITARNLELPPLSGYLAESIGQQIAQGQLDAQSQLKLSDGRLDVRNALAIRRLELKAVKDSAKARDQIGMPIGTALAVLRDRRGDIRLALPVSGTLSDPKFDLADALRTATNKAVRFAALSYVKQMIQPYGALITLAELGAAGLESAIRLDPLRFTPGNATFDLAAIDYLEKLAALLADRPSMRLRICGKAWTGETAAIPGTRDLDDKARDERLLLLARERAEAIKGALVAVHGVAAERLFVCQPETGDDEKLSGRTDLLI